MATMSKPRLLISGDSYMAWHGRDRYGNPDYFHKMNCIHWAYKLLPYFEIVNVAQAGASNAIILRNLSLAIKEQKPDYIVLGFTDHGRLEHAYDSEMNIMLTNVMEPVRNNKSLYSDYEKYVRYADLEYMFYKNLMLAEHAILLAKSVGKDVAFTPNAMSYNINFYDSIQSYQHLVNFNTECLPMSLKGHPESDNYSFHVSDETVHTHFAKCILDTFGVDTNNKEVVN